MSGILTFPVDDTLKAIVHHARTSPVRRPSYNEIFEGRYRRDGRDFDGEGFPSSDDVDPDKIPVGLWLVKDQGVYLMSPGSPMLDAPDGKGSLVAYAVEANPNTDEDFYQNAGDIMGGDDCVEKIGIEAFEEAIAANASKVTIRVTESSITIRFFR